MNRAIISQRITSILAEIERLNNALYAARRRSRIGTMVWWAGWCGIDPELSENVRAGLKAKDRSRHAQTGKPLYKTLYRQVRCGSLRTLLVSINTS